MPSWASTGPGAAVRQSSRNAPVTWTLSQSNFASKKKNLRVGSRRQEVLVQVLLGIAPRGLVILWSGPVVPQQIFGMVGELPQLRIGQFPVTCRVCAPDRKRRRRDSQLRTLFFAVCPFCSQHFCESFSQSERVQRARLEKGFRVISHAAREKSKIEINLGTQRSARVGL